MPAKLDPRKLAAWMPSTRPVLGTRYAIYTAKGIHPMPGYYEAAARLPAYRRAAPEAYVIALPA